MTDSAAGEPIRVLVADDHAAFRASLEALLATAGDLVVVGSATDAPSAVRLARSAGPDVVLMDLDMPGGGGLEATRAIVDAAPHVAVLVLTMSDDDDSIFAAVRSGARGYAVKGARRGELLRAIRAVAAGEAIFGPGVARRMLAWFARPRPGIDATPFPELTDREREILDLIAGGASNADITNRLVLSPKTVRNHITNIFSKLQVRDRSEAIVRAREAGLGGAEQGR